MNHFPNYSLMSSRSVPWLVRGQLLLGGPFNFFGWLWLLFCTIFVWAFGAQTSLSGLHFLLRPTETASGNVTVIEGTNASENETPVYANYYTFRVEALETEFYGLSYTTGQTFSLNQNVTVEYIRDAPEISRLEGARTGVFSPWVFCFLGLFVAVGLGFVGFGLKSGLKANQLLTHGQPALGRLVAKAATNTRINKQTVYKLTFEFTAADGQRYQTEARSHQPAQLEDDDREELLYDPRQPSRAVLLDNLPGAPEIDETGRVHLNGYQPSYLIFILPGLVLMTNALAFVIVSR